MASRTVHGTLLFLLTLNDPVAQLELLCFTFADDMKVIGVNNREQLANDVIKYLTAQVSGICCSTKVKVAY